MILLTWISLVTCVTSIIQDVNGCEMKQVNQPIGERLRLNCCELRDQNASWWKDGDKLSNSTTGGTLYTRNNIQYGDGGEYFCNITNTNQSQSFQVRVGEKPPEPDSPVCNKSANTTILCTATKNSDLVKTICMETVKQDDCQNTTATLYIDLVKECEYERRPSRCEVTVRVSNDFGNSIKNTRFASGLLNKVSPDTPEIVTLIPISQIQFDALLRLPATWKKSDGIEYQYELTLLNKTRESDWIMKEWFPLRKEDFIPFTVDLKTKSVWTEVCIRVRFKHALLSIKGTSNYSRPVCKYTPELAPSAPPQNFIVKEDKRRGNSGMVIFSWEPPPKAQRNGFIRRYELKVEETDSRTTTTWNITGEMTDINLKNELEEERTYEVYLSAWTNGGKSNEAVLTLRAHQRISVATWVILTVTSAAATLILLRLSCILHRKMRADHIYVTTPEIKMLHKVQEFARNASSQPQKEVFDTLKRKDDHVIPANGGMDDDDHAIADSCHIDSDQGIYIPREDFEGTDSGVLLRSSTYSRSGARSYTLAPASPGAITPDDLNERTDVGEPYVQSIPTCTVPTYESSEHDYVKYSQLNRNDSGCFMKAASEPDPIYERVSLPDEVTVHENR